MGSLKVAHIATADITVRVLLLNQLLAFRDAGFDVVAICAAGAYAAEVQRAGIRVVPVPMVRAITPGSDLKSLLRLYRVLRRERPDVVHTHTPKGGLLGQFAALLARVPIRVHTIHGLYFPRHMSRATRPFYVALERATMRFVHMALSQNPEDIPVAIEERICAEDRLRLLGNGIDLSRFDPSRVTGAALERLRQSLQLEPGDRVVGIVGRVNTEKGHLEFFEAAAEIARTEPRARFLIIGPVEAEKANALDPLALARKYNLEAQVRCLGMRSDMPELYAVMDVLVLPSHREGFPRALMEAAAMESPVVATDIRGCRQAVQDGVTGTLVPVQAPQALAAAILRLLRDDTLARRMGKAGRDYALREFDERRVVTRTIECYRHLAAERHVQPDTVRIGRAAGD